MHGNIDEPTSINEEPPAAQIIHENEKQKFDNIPVIFKLCKNFKHFANLDWIQISKKSKVLNAPVQYSVSDFLFDYCEEQKDSNTLQFINNFISFLNIAIGKKFLYRQERLHYLPLFNRSDATLIYGPEILIRFFGNDLSLVYVIITIRLL